MQRERREEWRNREEKVGDERDKRIKEMKIKLRRIEINDKRGE